MHSSLDVSLLTSKLRPFLALLIFTYSNPTMSLNLTVSTSFSRILWWNLTFLKYSYPTYNYVSWNHQKEGIHLGPLFLRYFHGLGDKTHWYLGAYITSIHVDFYLVKKEVCAQFIQSAFVIFPPRVNLAQYSHKYFQLDPDHISLPVLANHVVVTSPFMNEFQSWLPLTCFVISDIESQ